MTHPQQAIHLANAYILVAQVNHYLVQTVPCSDDARDAAEQVLIEWDNAAGNADPVLNLALDILGHDRGQSLYRASRGETVG